MAPSTRVTIGIQARSTSSRLPGKVDRLLGSKTVLSHVISQCEQAAMVLNRYNDKNGLMVQTVVCVPEGDPIKRNYGQDIKVIEGPEGDVLKRYRILSDQMRSDYVVRITSDCPLITDFIIHKHVTVAVKNRYDYLSNVDPRCRTSADGMDCEVISRKLLEWMDENATQPLEREHVTPMARENPPSWASRGFIINALNLSALKLSLDTLEDEEKIKAAYREVQERMQIAEEIYGKSQIHRFS